MWQNPTTWVTIAFFTFLAVFGKKLWRAMVQALDARAARIAHELKEAEALRQEAENTLAMYRKKYQDSVQEAEEIIGRARKSAEQMLAQAETELKATMDRRIRQATDRIEEEEKRAILDVRNHVVDITVAAARAIVTEQLQQRGGDAGVRQAIADLERKVH